MWPVNVGQNTVFCFQLHKKAFIWAYSIRMREQYETWISTVNPTTLSLCIWSMSNLWYQHISPSCFFYELFRYSDKYRPFFFAYSHQHHVKTKVFSSLLISHFLHLSDVPYYSDFHWPPPPPNQKNTTSAVRIFLATNNFVGMPEFSSFIKRSFSLSSPFRLLWKSFEYWPTVFPPRSFRCIHFCVLLCTVWFATGCYYLAH